MIQSAKQETFTYEVANATYKVKVVDGIHFIWIPYYKRGVLDSHWHSLNGHRVRIFLPKSPGSSWTVAVYNTSHEEPDATHNLKVCHPENENDAFKYAVHWAKYGVI